MSNTVTPQVESERRTDLREWACELAQSWLNGNRRDVIATIGDIKARRKQGAIVAVIMLCLPDIARAEFAMAVVTEYATKDDTLARFAR